MGMLIQFSEISIVLIPKLGVLGYDGRKKSTISSPDVSARRCGLILPWCQLPPSLAEPPTSRRLFGICHKITCDKLVAQCSPGTGRGTAN